MRDPPGGRLANSPKDSMQAIREITSTSGAHDANPLGSLLRCCDSKPACIKAVAEKVAQEFNQRYGHRATVGKSFVADCLKKHRHELTEHQREIKNRKPWPTKVNALWAMDLTFHADEHGQQLTASLTTAPGC